MPCASCGKSDPQRQHTCFPLPRSSRTRSVQCDQGRGKSSDTERKQARTRPLRGKHHAYDALQTRRKKEHYSSPFGQLHATPDPQQAVQHFSDWRETGSTSSSTPSSSRPITRAHEFYIAQDTHALRPPRPHRLPRPPKPTRARHAAGITQYGRGSEHARPPPPPPPPRGRSSAVSRGTARGAAAAPCWPWPGRHRDRHPPAADRTRAA